MKLSKHTTYLLHLDEPPTTVELRHYPIGEDNVRVAVDGGIITVRYLIRDDWPSNPLEDWDGNGRIHSSSRWAGRDSHAAMQAALGLDTNWQPDLSLFEAEADMAISETPGQYDLTAEDCDRRTGAYWDAIESYSRTLWRDHRAAGELGDPYAVLLDCYEHGLTEWRVSSDHAVFLDERWDVGRGGGVWVPDRCARDDIELRPPAERKDRAREIARQAVELWNAYINGDIWELVIEEFDTDGVRLHSPEYQSWYGGLEAQKALEDQQL